MSDEFFDLFGNPVVVKDRKRGRPAFEWTPEKSNKVRLGLALGWTVPRIANGLAISTATLKRYFRAELKERDIARDQLDLQRVALAMEQAGKGNVGAMRQLDRLIEANDRMRASARITEGQGEADEPEAKAKVRAVGKKEAQRQAAQDVGGEGSVFGDLLRPGFDRVN